MTIETLETIFYWTITGFWVLVGHAICGYFYLLGRRHERHK